MRCSSSKVWYRNSSPGGAGVLFRMNSHSSMSAIGLHIVHVSGDGWVVVSEWVGGWVHECVGGWVV